MLNDWQISNHPHVPLANVSVFPDVHWLGKDSCFDCLSETLQSKILNCFTTRTLLESLTFPCNSLTIDTFLRLQILMRVGYFLSLGCSPCLFPEPALSPLLFFFFDNHEPNDLYYYRPDNGRTTPLYLLLDTWNSPWVVSATVDSGILVVYWPIVLHWLDFSQPTFSWWRVQNGPHVVWLCLYLPWNSLWGLFTFFSVVSC